MYTYTRGARGEKVSFGRKLRHTRVVNIVKHLYSSYDIQSAYNLFEYSPIIHSGFLTLWIYIHIMYFHMSILF